MSSFYFVEQGFPRNLAMQQPLQAVMATTATAVAMPQSTTHCVKVSKIMSSSQLNCYISIYQYTN